MHGQKNIKLSMKRVALLMRLISVKVNKVFFGGKQAFFFK